MDEMLNGAVGGCATGCVNFHKVAVVGCGMVGSTIAFSLMESGLFAELVMIDVDHRRAEGEAMDISHGVPFAHPMKICAGDYAAIGDAGLVIVAAGANQQPGESRLDLIDKNIQIFRQIIPEIAKPTFRGILLVVSNPVDILTQVALQLSGLPEHRVIGSGTVLDTARLKYAVGDYLQVDSRSVHAFVIGEHGDSEIVAWSCANVSGIALTEFCRLRGRQNYENAIEKLAEEVRTSAYQIISRKRATYYGIACSVRRICEAIVRNERSILSISSMIDGEYGIERTVLSMPTIVGMGGIEARAPLKLSEQELQALQGSARQLQEIFAKQQL